MSTGWVLVGGDEPLLGSLADAMPVGTDAATVGSDIASTVRAALEAGEQRFAIIGGDRELHAAVDAMRACIDDGWSGAPLAVRFPDDPSIDPADAVQLLVALLPIEPGGLAATLGLGLDPRATVSMLATDHAWGPLDVGLVTIDARTSVLVSTLDLGIDRLERPLLGKRPEVQVTIELDGRRAKRRRDEAVTHRGVPEPLGWITIANGQYEGQARIAPRAVPHDRAFDVSIGRGDARAVTRWRRAARRAAHVPDPSIEEWLCDRVTVRCSAPVPARLDGSSIEGERFEVRLARLGIALKI